MPYYYPFSPQPIQPPVQQPIQQMQPVQQQMQPMSQSVQQMNQNQEYHNGGFTSVRSEEEALNWPIAPGNYMTFKIQDKPIVIEKKYGILTA